MIVPGDEVGRPSGDPLSLSPEQFVEQWCSGQEPEHGPDAQRLLAVVARVIPAAYQQLAEGTSWGPLTVAPLIELGAVIDATEPIPGSAPVLARLAAGDPAARSELKVARSLADRGLVVELEPELAGRKPDFRVVEPDLVYGEVVTPDLSAPAQALAESGRHALAALLQHVPWGGQLEVVMSGDADPAQVALWLAPRIGDTVVEQTPVDVPDAAASYSLTQIEPGMPPQLAGTLELPAPALGFAGAELRDGAPAGPSSEFPSPTTAPAGSSTPRPSTSPANTQPSSYWTPAAGRSHRRSGGPLLERRFQPAVDTRFSAAALFRRNLNVDSTHDTDWTLLANPHAKNLLPERLTTVLRSSGQK